MLNRELAKFITVGGISAAVDFSVLFLAARVVDDHAAFFIAYPAGVITHFFLNKFWTFGCTRRDWGKQLLQYGVTISVAFIVQAAAYSLAIHFLTAHLGANLLPLVAKACAIPPSTLAGYWMLKAGAFRRPEAESPADAT